MQGKEGRLCTGEARDYLLVLCRDLESVLNNSGCTQFPL